MALMLVVVCCMMSAIMFSNWLVVLSVYRHRKDTLKEPRWLLVSCLATADFTVGFAGLLFFSVKTSGGTLSMAFCLTDNSLSIASIMVSSLCLVSLSLDQWLAICRPLRYTQLVTRGRTMALCLIIWLVSLVAVLLTSPLISDLYLIEGDCPYFTVEQMLLCFITCFVLPLLVYGITFFKILLVVCKTQEKPRNAVIPVIKVHPPEISCNATNVEPHVGVAPIEHTPPPVVSSGSDSTSQPPRSPSNNGQDSAATAPSAAPTDRAASRRPPKAFVTFSIIIILFLLCWLPALFGLLYSVSVGGQHVLGLAEITVASLNSIVNPVVYAVRFPALRSAFKKILLCRPTSHI